MGTTQDEQCLVRIWWLVRQTQPDEVKSAAKATIARNICAQGCGGKGQRWSPCVWGWKVTRFTYF